MKAIIKYSHCGSLILIMGLLDCVLVTWETISKMTGFDWNGAIMSSSSSRSPSKGNLVSVNKYLSCFILLLSTDINLNPGPPAKAIKCQVCFKTIRRNQTSATCCQCIMQISIRTAGVFQKWPWVLLVNSALVQMIQRSQMRLMRQN